MPFHIRDIDHLVLRVVDLEAMLGFYCGVLGCTVERRQEAIGLVQLRAGRSLIDLVPIDGVLPSKETVLSKKYPYARPTFYYTNGEATGEMPGKLIRGPQYTSAAMAAE